MTTSYGDDYEELENCGVDFDHTCYNNGYMPTDAVYLEELLGECEEDDQECISRYLQQRKKASAANSLKKNASNIFKTGGNDKDENADAIAASTQVKTTPLGPHPMPPPPPNFEGLPKNYYKKNYKPDYPADLQMKQLCSSKPLRRRTLGITRTQPRAVFIPSKATLENQDQKSMPASPNVTGAAAPFVKSGSEHDILFEPSPLDQNRLPPAVVSSSDEVVVDWLESHNVQMMFEYFLGLCVINQPENPWAFISDLCGKMIEARNDLTAFDNLPRVLTPEHTEAIFRIYDRIENGCISVPQYKSAMDAMGLNRYSTNPDGWEENAISKDTFVKEATTAIDDLLRTFMVFEQQSQDGQKGSNTDLGRSKSAANVKKSSYSGSGTGTSTSSYSVSRSGTNGSRQANNTTVSPEFTLDNPTTDTNPEVANPTETDLEIQ